MIRRTLPATKAATFSVLLPHPDDGRPSPIGTGFFVSGDGWFVTAAHVVTVNTRPDGLVRPDIVDARLVQEARFFETGAPSRGCQHVTVGPVLPAFDLALLKVDFAANSTKDWLKSRRAFPSLRVASRNLEEGEPVYAFGYPLSESTLHESPSGFSISSTDLCPRVTSAIVSSTFEVSRMVGSPADPQLYVLDKALNYGNSGGPIIATATGQVHAVCSRFQPTEIRQADRSGIIIPSLYGVASSLSNGPVLELLRSLGIPIDDT